MKIALIVQRFPGGGAESYVMELAERLTKNGHDVTVVTSNSTYAGKDQYPFSIIRLDPLFSIGEYSIWKGLKDVLKKFQSSLVHINTYGHFHSDLAAFYKKSFRYKTVLTSHGFHGIELRLLGQTGNLPLYSPLKMVRKLRPIYDKTLGRMEITSSDALIALSRRDVEVYTELGAQTERIRVIPPGVRDLFFTTPNQEKIRKLKDQLDGEPLILSVGELSWVKAKDLPLKALPLIIREEPKAKLVYIGKDGGLKKSLIDLARKLEVENRVIFLNYINDYDLVSYLHISDILLHTSLAEGLSTILLEAMACQLPFITTRAGGNGYLAEETGAGLAVPFNDEKALADTVIRLWQDKSLMREVKNKASIHASNFSWNKVFDEIVEVYNEVLAYDNRP